MGHQTLYGEKTDEKHDWPWAVLFFGGIVLLLAEIMISVEIWFGI